MSKYTDEELEGLLASGDAKRNEDGSITWAINNAFDKKPGTWLVKPPTAAPLITPETGAEMAKMRRDRRQAILEDAVAEAFDVTDPDEAVAELAKALVEIVKKEDHKDRLKAIDRLLERFGLGEQKGPLIDQRTQQLIVVDPKRKEIAEEYQYLFEDEDE